MLGYVLGRDGDIHDFIETLKRVHGSLDDSEIQLVRELVELATHPGYTINMAEKLSLTSVELSDYLQHLRACGLIDYWEKAAKPLSLLSE
ncbi:hypothetical protein [Levilactobacillus zymae]|uniref:Uncharacterized protein n=1 Tax=Levilactobacillus zymae TaxID=267363 RepID=A0A1Y6JYD5_9LACO|nr:hypothetical protein [Levilactobacillus zymae]SMS14151.1 hypothetical protein LZ3411_1101 [Levilactobacillus zymae]